MYEYERRGEKLLPMRQFLSRVAQQGGYVLVAMAIALPSN